MTWLEIVELAIFMLLLVVVLPLAWLFARRRWLSAKGGVFDCGLRLRDQIPGGGWSLGLARYDGNILEWYRIFSFTFRPRLRLDRSTTSMVSRREPDQVEALVLFADHQVVRLRESRSGSPDGDTKDWELAMTPASITGLLSWLEAAPPGGGRYPGVE